MAATLLCFGLLLDFCRLRWISRSSADGRFACVLFIRPAKLYHDGKAPFFQLTYMQAARVSHRQFESGFTANSLSIRELLTWILSEFL